MITRGVTRGEISGGEISGGEISGAGVAGRRTARPRIPTSGRDPDKRAR